MISETQERYELESAKKRALDAIYPEVTCHGFEVFPGICTLYRVMEIKDFEPVRQILATDDWQESLQVVRVLNSAVGLWEA